MIIDSCKLCMIYTLNIRCYVSNATLFIFKPTEKTDSLAPCVGWRQTSDCRPDGSRKPDYDHGCNAPIQDDWSGYCECFDGQIGLMKNCNQIVQNKTCHDFCFELDGKLILNVSEK